MAEAVALAAGIIAFVQVVDRIIVVCKYYIETADGCPRDVRTILVEVSSLKALLQNLDFILKCDSPPSPTLEKLTGSDGPIEACRKSLEDLEKLLPRVPQMILGKKQRVLSAAQHLAWPLKQGLAQTLMRDISQHKATITLALTSDSLTDIKSIKSSVTEIKDILMDAQCRDFFQWLETINPSSNHNNAYRLYEQGTGAWVLRLDEWKQWLGGMQRFLWIHGIPGAGKTILASFLIEQVQSAICDEKFIDEQQKQMSHSCKQIACVSYYCYFAHNQDETAPLLRWIIGQLCRQAKAIPNRLTKLYQRGQEPRIPQLLDALESILSHFDVVFIMVDAVDESLPRETLLKVLRDLATDNRFGKIRLLATSREYFDIETCFSPISVSLSTTHSENEKDIRIYVHSELSRNRKFKNWPPALLIEVEDSLAKGSKGMFRWAVCQVDALQRCKSQEDVRIAIRNLPKTLDETYERIFQIIPPEDQQFVYAVLAIVRGCTAFNYPSIEVTVLLDIAKAHLRFTGEGGMEHCFYTTDTIRELCGCLIINRVTEDPAYESASFAHYTVQEYLSSDRIIRGPVSAFALNVYTGLDILFTTSLRMYLEWKMDNKPLNNSTIMFCNIVSFDFLRGDTRYKQAGIKAILEKNKRYIDMLMKSSAVDLFGLLHPSTLLAERKHDHTTPLEQA
ncbi:hypothetical protein FQN50_001936 [Emmonsiellopsis sp. PD_5]|nr:hypothetical protein FQN50_001936 [Emmonsiellopsis sp. PD_5]